MPPKRKATDIAGISPSKRAALTTTNAYGEDTPARRTRSTKCAPVVAPVGTPKVRRTYGKQAAKEQEDVQEVENAAPERNDQTSLDTNSETDLVASPSMGARGRRKQVSQQSPSKRHSKGLEVDQEPSSRPTETPRRVKQTYTKQIVVVVPLPPQVKVSSPSPSPRPSSPLVETHCDPTTPRKAKPRTKAHVSLEKGQSLLSSKQLPSQFYPCLNAQKKAILRTLHDSTNLFNVAEETSTERSAQKQLEDLLQGTIARSEGNSCLLLGPRGSGKSKAGKSISRHGILLTVSSTDS